MKTKNWAPWLVIATMIMMVVRYSAAFAASDMGQITGAGSDFVTFLTGLTGIGMGVLDTAGGGFLFNGWSRVFPRTGNAWSIRFKVLSVCVFGLLFSGMFILVPFTMSRLAHESVLDTLGGKESFWAWMWSATVWLSKWMARKVPVSYRKVPFRREILPVTCRRIGGKFALHCRWRR
jgi:hypothetical protein